MKTPREILSAAPLPIAQTLARAWTGKSAQERHNAALYAMEASIKLATVVRIARWTKSPKQDASAHVLALERGSLGQWVAAFRALDAGEPLELPRCAALATKLSSAGVLSKDGSREVHRRGLVGVFGAVVTYRNQILGHGSQREESFYAGLEGAWRDAVSEVVLSGALLFGGRLLLAPASLEEPWLELTGPIPLPTDSASDASEGHVVAEIEGEIYDLHPLITHDEDATLARHRVGFLNRVKRSRGSGQVVTRAEYLDYATGASLQVGAADDVHAYFAALGAEENPSNGAAEAAGAATGAQVGPYRIDEELGRGAMGVVYAAHHVELDTRVALKLMSESLAGDAGARTRFQREVAALARVDHPNVVGVIDADAGADRPYYAMEFVDGHDLTTPPEASPQTLATWFAGAAEGLAALHDQGVLHRDLKPANLMVTSNLDRLVVMDLGLARIADASRGLTRSEGGILGTLRYVPPEQLDPSRGTVDARSDVYALGATLFEMLTGRPLIDGKGQEALVRAALEPDRLGPADVDPDIPIQLDAIVRMATRPDPAHRYTDASAFAADLRAFAEGAPVVARPPTRWEHVRYRMRGRWPAAGAVVALALAAAGAGLYQWDQTRLKVALYAEARWSPDMLIGFGEPVPGKRRVRVTTQGGRTVRVEALTASGGPEPMHSVRLRKVAFGLSLLLEAKGAEINWTQVEKWRSGSTFPSTVQDLAYDGDGQLIRVVHRRPGGLPAGSATVERREGGGLRLRWLDTVGTPSASPEDAVAVEDLDFNDAGRLVERRFFNVSGVQPAADALGAFGRRVEHDALGRVVSEWWLDAAGTPVDNQRGFAEVRTAWHGETMAPASVAWHDTEGTPTLVSEVGCATLTIGAEGSPITCTGATGEPALRFLEPAQALRCHVAEHEDDGPTRRTTCLGIQGEHRGVQVWERNALGHTVEIRILDEDGQPRPGEQLWAFANHHVRPDGLLTAMPQYRDAGGEPYLPNDTNKGDPEDYVPTYPMAYDYDPSGLVQARFVDPDGEEILGPYGYSRIEIARDAAGRVTEAALFDVRHHPAQTASGVHRVEYERNVFGRPESMARFAANGEPAFDVFGVHRDEMVWDDQGLLLRQAWFDADGPMNKPPSGLRGAENHAVQMTYDERGLPTKVAYLTADGEHPVGRPAWEIFTHDAQGRWTGFGMFAADGTPTVSPGSGVHRMYVRETAKGEILDLRTWGPDGEPMLGFMGCHRVVGEQDARGQLLVSHCLDGDGLPVPFEPGDASSVWHVYDDHDRLVELRWEDPEGQLAAANPAGQARLVQKLDDAGRVRENTVYGVDGAPTASGPRGAATSAYSYDPAGQVVEAVFRDPQGLVVEGGKGHITCQRNEVGTPIVWSWFHADGSLMQRMRLDVAANQRPRTIQFENDDGGVVDSRYGWAQVHFERRQDTVEARFVDADGNPASLGGSTTWRGDGARVRSAVPELNDVYLQGGDFGFGLYDPSSHAELPTLQGWSGWRATLSPGRHVVRRTYLDGAGEPVVPADPGYATQVVDWEGPRRAGIRYLDANGDPMTVCGVARVAFEGRTVEAFDLEGHAVEIPEACRDGGGVRAMSPAANHSPETHVRTAN